MGLRLLIILRCSIALYYLTLKFSKVLGKCTLAMIPPYNASTQDNAAQTHALDCVRSHTSQEVHRVSINFMTERSSLENCLDYAKLNLIFQKKPHHFDSILFYNTKYLFFYLLILVTYRHVFFILECSMKISMLIRQIIIQLYCAM